MAQFVHLEHGSNIWHYLSTIFEYKNSGVVGVSTLTAVNALTSFSSKHLFFIFIFLYLYFLFSKHFSIKMNKFGKKWFTIEYQ